MLNVMTKLDNAVTAVIKTVGLFSSCINSSAKGTGSPGAGPHADPLFRAPAPDAILASNGGAESGG